MTGLVDAAGHDLSCTCLTGLALVYRATTMMRLSMRVLATRPNLQRAKVPNILFQLSVVRAVHLLRRLLA